MDRKEVNERFNALPREHRTTIIGNELDQEVRWLERLKRDTIKEHKTRIANINKRINALNENLRRLKDD